MSEDKPTIYVITYHEFNHGSLRPGAPSPLDKRFLEGKGNYVFYLIDKEVPEVLKDQKVLLEYNIDPVLYEAGGKHLGEWSFLLAEEKHSFCEYPLFMISSRFYEKNSWLHRDLNGEWESLFKYLKQYGYGYLPSYDRPLRWIDLSWEKNWRKKVWKYTYFPYTDKTYQLIEDIFHVNIPKEYRYTSDLFCNYIGFNSRAELLAYVDFYKPLINYFFDQQLQVKKEVFPYIRKTNSFRNEKSFTLFLELICHLFFFQTKKTFFALHYDGYYAVDESKKILQKLEKIRPLFFTTVKRYLRWQVQKLRTEGCLAPFNHHINVFKRKLKNILGRT